MSNKRKKTHVTSVNHQGQVAYKEKPVEKKPHQKFFLQKTGQQPPMSREEIEADRVLEAVRERIRKEAEAKEAIKTKEQLEVERAVIDEAILNANLKVKESLDARLDIRLAHNPLPFKELEPVDGTPHPEELFKSGVHVLQFRSNDMLEGHVPNHGVAVLKDSEVPELRWKGGRIPIGMFREILAFMNWVNDTYKTEATSRWYYHKEKKVWHAEVYPQYICVGLAAKELDAHDMKQTISESILAKGFTFNGSLHSHCNAGAFQSGIDSKDELVDTGVHFTVGTLDQLVADFDARFTYSGICYPVVDSDWFEEPLSQILSMTNLPSFPEEWKDRMMQKPPTAQNIWSGWKGNKTRGKGGNNQNSNYDSMEDWYYDCYGNDYGGEAHGAGGSRGTGGWSGYNHGGGSTTPGKAGQAVHKPSGKYVPRLSKANSPHQYMTSIDVEAFVAQIMDDIGGANMKLPERMVSQMMVMTIMMARSSNYFKSPATCSTNFGWKTNLSSLVTQVDTILDSYNPVFEVMASSQLFDNEILAGDWGVEMLTRPEWKEEIRILVQDCSFFTEDVMEETSMIFGEDQLEFVLSSADEINGVENGAAPSLLDAVFGYAGDILFPKSYEGGTEPAADVETVEETANNMSVTAPPVEVESEETEPKPPTSVVEGE